MNIINDLTESRSTSIVLGVILLGLAFLAHKWTYETTLYRRAQRKNQQWALTTALAVVGVLMLLVGAGVL